MERKLELLRGLDISDDQLNIRVDSGGCTKKEHFEIEIIKGITGQPPFIIEIYRIIPDECEAFMPNGVLLEFSLKELALKPTDILEIKNKFKI